MIRLDKGSTKMMADAGLRQYMTSVFNKMFLGLLVTAGAGYLCSNSPEVLQFMMGGFSILLFFATFGIVIYLSARVNKISADKANLFFWIYSILMGAWLSPIAVAYTSASIVNAFLSTALFFGLMSLYGSTTKRDLTGLGSFMFIGLISIILASLVNLFLKSSAMSIGLSALTIIIFAGLTAYDVQKISRFYTPGDSAESTKKKAIIGALSLYLDFLNMFLAMLRLFGDRR